MDRIISTNTIFHFTRSFEKIISILKNDFYCQYCVEYFYDTIFPASAKSARAIPMVCFCDVPLFQIKKHTRVYGNYAIGLTKDWAIKNKINPVIYAYYDSAFTGYFKLALNSVFNNKNLDSNYVLKKFLFTMQYIKPYEGPLWRDGNIVQEKVRFYDEREWRYIPFTTNLEEPLILNSNSSGDYEAIQKLNMDISKKNVMRLSFEPDDIRFIIVEKENQILNMIDEVTNIKRSKFSMEKLQILHTRIVSMETIEENF